MKIALIGYGKMGKAVERIAMQKGHEIVLKINSKNLAELNASNLKKADVAIEFSNPENAVNNIECCLNANLPVITGTTGWLDKWERITNLVAKNNGSLLYASNFSIGVNLFFELNQFLARLMASHPEYKVGIKEIHHTQKKDAPSGTAISLANQVIANNNSKKEWINEPADDQEKLVIISERKDPTPGTHEVIYQSPIDTIEIKHTAHNREGFAIGAVLAAEFIKEKKGIFSMKEVIEGELLGYKD